MPGSKRKGITHPPQNANSVSLACHTDCKFMKNLPLAERREYKGGIVNNRGISYCVSCSLMRSFVFADTVFRFGGRSVRDFSERIVGASTAIVPSHAERNDPVRPPHSWQRVSRSGNIAAGFEQVLSLELFSLSASAHECVFSFVMHVRAVCYHLQQRSRHKISISRSNNELIVALSNLEHSRPNQGSFP